MALFSHLNDIDLEKEVQTLSRELASLKRAVSKRGGAYYDGGREAAWDLYSDVADRIGDALPSIRKRARALETTARDHPATAATVGLVVLGLVATLIYSRRR